MLTAERVKCNLVNCEGKKRVVKVEGRSWLETKVQANAVMDELEEEG